ncbi:UDP-2,3-diacylglucosamine diphosphatase [Desulfuromonas carbonis]|uniref:UDP-2,3-diacylglucosamine diphosphatase n=1 Tax=Desulfuromonas sp. DDH964 TaxID=1823759 RepID=UPI00078BC6E5|nr:UDP-2,3-diacylglucosamine diphosphatase [Desulfuromonas sp. DDH964]AMV71943.1 UDP-2,3-diacylglucosamine hydrolase [Desulfuromonas sp. DDH964]
MRDIFLADAHLRHPDDPSYRRLLAFLAEQRGQVRTLYLLGDIFDFWLGFRHTVYAAHVPLLAELRKLHEAGTELVCVEGNHDFHLGPYFSAELGARILPDGGAVAIDGQQIYLAHGDLVNAGDRGYRRLRRLLRSPLIRALAQVVHPDWTWVVYRWLEARSIAGKPAKVDRQLPLDLLRRHARERFAAGCQVVITGHFHIPHHETTAAGTLLSLGGWLEQSAYAVVEDGRFTLMTY